MKKFDKEFVADLACFMNGYVKEIQGHLIDEAERIYADPMLRKLLHEHRVQHEKRDADFVHDLDWCLNDGFHRPEVSCLNRAKSYHDVLDDLLVKDWWSAEYDKKREGAA